MHILFITEKYCSGPQFGYTNSMHNIIGSYEAAKYGTYEHLFIDQENLWSVQAIDNELLTREYDLAFISAFDGKNVSLNTAKILRNKVVTCWWDSILIPPGSYVPLDTYKWWEYSQHSPQILFDVGHGEEYPNVFCMEVPQDTRMFNNIGIAEEHDIGFAGCLLTRAERRYYLQLLKDNGFSVVSGGGRGGGHDNLTDEKYVSILKSAKICLNLCIGHGRPQRKGRAFEITACGKFMLSDFPETFSGKNGPFFQDGIDYISFQGNNIVDKVKYYLDNKTERDKIALSGYEKYMNNYSPKHFWKKVFDICKI